MGTDLTIGSAAAGPTTIGAVIDEMRLYKRILGAIEVTTNYQGGDERYWPSNINDLVGWWHIDEGTGLYIFDWTSGGNTGTITGALWVDGFNFQIMTNVPRR